MRGLFPFLITFVVITAFILPTATFGQVDSPEREEIPMDYRSPTEYNLADISVKGNGRINKDVIIAYTGLKVGQKISIPGEEVSEAIRKLWDQGLFEDVSIKINKIENNNVFLLIDLQTLPRLAKFKINGVSKNDASDIREKIRLNRGKILTRQLISRVKTKIKDHFEEEGYLKASIDIGSKEDSLFNKRKTTLVINVDKGEKIKIKDILFIGNESFKDRKLRSAMENTNRKSLLNLFKSAKFKPEKYEEDKKKVVQFYNKHGFRDAKITSDSIYYTDEDRIKLQLEVNEGQKYYFGDISWTGNSKYSTEFLNSVLNIDKGEIYNPELLQRKLRFNPRGLDVSSLYMDNGYLFFNVNPVETKVYNDTVDLEIRINEGKQAIIDEISISGNTKTSDHVILRELRTRPGDKFSRSDIIRSRRELAQLGYFDEKKINITPQPNPEEGTVDINYDVVEKPSDQLQLQGGWGAGQLVGSVGIQFNNFSLDKINDFDAWKPLPSGDGQKLSLKAYSNGRRYSSFNFSFTEPWLGGRKPNSLTVGAYYSIQARGERGTPQRQSLRITGVNVGLGKRLNFPDNYFQLNNSLEFQRYKLDDYQIPGLQRTLGFQNGESYTLSIKHKISRNSVNEPIYPTSGSKYSLSVKYTPPYSSFNNLNYEEVSTEKKFKWLEFHRWKFNSSYFLNLFGDFVLNARAKFGYLGFYNQDIGVTPFERFFIGGDGLQGFQLDGRELIRLRGYPENSLNPNLGANIFNKYTMELRYPIIQKRSATIYFQTFLEGGNGWFGIENFNPFDIRRSGGVGIRVFLPMFGKLGVDWGYGFDTNDLPGYVPGETQKSHIHISIGQRF